MAIRTRTGAVNAPLAPTALRGAELAAAQAMGVNAKYWRAFAKAFAFVNTPDMIWQPRLGPVALNTVLTSDNPTFVDGSTPYVAFNGSTGKAMRTPSGVEVIPSTAFAIIANVFQPGTADGVILGNRAHMTVASDGTNNTQWAGLITGIIGNPDNLAACTRGQAQRASAGAGYRDNAWHTISMVYSPGESNVLRLRVDGQQVGANTSIQTPLNALGLRTLILGAAYNISTSQYMSPFTGRVNAVAVVPSDLHDTQALADIEGYFGSLIGVSI